MPPSVVVASNPSAQVRTVNIVTVPSGRFLSREEMQSLQSGPPLLEHEPQPEQLEQLEQLAEFCETSAAPALEEQPPEPPAQPSERDLILQRARAMGYTPLPPRPHQDD